MGVYTNLMRRIAVSVCVGFCASGSLVAIAADANDKQPLDAPIEFNRDIAPILAANCFECHGPDAKKRETEFRLDTRAGAIAKLKSGGFAIVPGNRAKSTLIKRITSTDDDVRMPPPDSKKTLTRDQIRLLTRWISQGAKWQRHWAFITPQRPAIPVVKNKKSVQNDIDAFILARLESAGLTPAPPSDRRTLVRRAFFDLTGLPPTVAEVNRFLNDKSPTAYAELIDRLLASPRYGERWGRHWLDIARYGDSNGGDENHLYPNAYHYRNYVIEAFNRDLPYDRFLQEQLAGDLLPPDDGDRHTSDRVTATGFLALGTKILAEKDPAKKRADMVDEQLDTFGKAVLGLAIGCARCHDHKFDPIPTADYYALAGIFHSTNVRDRALQRKGYPAAKKAYDEKRAAIKAETDQLNKLVAAKIKDGSAILREAESFDRGNVATDKSRYGKGIGIISDPGGQKNFAEYDITLSGGGDYLIQLRYAAKDARPGRLIINAKAVKSNILSGTTGSWFPNTQRWFSEGIYALKKGKNTLRLESEPMMSHIDKLRIIPKDTAGDLHRALARIDELGTELAALEKAIPRTTHKVMALADGSIRNVKIHLRGNHLSLGKEVPRQFLRVMSEETPKSLPGNQSGRLQLARWLTRPDTAAGGLASRVMVNRIWHWHFGRGIVGSPNDFGTRGDRPTHPLLLDYLAHRFVHDGWSIKSMHRLIMLSSTYQMSTQNKNANSVQIDPENRLHWRFKRRRLEAEVIRDTLIAHAGRLDRSLGGGPPTIKSQNPSPADLVKNRRFYETSRRRTVYLPVVRTNVYKFLTLLDFPNAGTPVGKRATTTVPTQALMMMNSPFVIAQAEHSAKRILADEKLADEAARLTRLYVRLFSRPPSAEETRWAAQFIDTYEKSLKDEADASARRLIAWTALCQTLFASNEFFYVN
jgi:cytochrome c553